MKLIRAIFYGNIFYGFCTVALSVESNLQHGIALNSFRLYLLLFLATIIYYSRIYYTSSTTLIDDRSIWYRTNKPAIRILLLAIAAVICIDLLLMTWLNRIVLRDMNMYYWSLLIIVPVIGLLYTFQFLPVKKLRRIGWLKPFIIGFVWAGVVTIFPVMFWQIQHADIDGPPLLLKVLIWLQNFLFISMLAVVFDIKDFATDLKYQLDTYPTLYGISNTIKFVIIPVALLSVACTLITNYLYHQSTLLGAFQIIPYVFLFLLLRSFTKQKHLLFYLAAVDGLMLLKGICGIIGLSFIK